MPNSRPTPAEMLEGLRTELAEVEKQMADFRALQRRQADLQNAINAVQKLIPGAGPMAPPVFANAADAINQQIRQLTEGLTRPVGAPPVKVEMVSPPRTLIEAAERVLATAMRPMHIKQLVAGVRATGITGDRTPEQVRTSLVPSLNRLAAQGERFWKHPEKPEYGLIGWEKPAK